MEGDGESENLCFQVKGKILHNVAGPQIYYKQQQMNRFQHFSIDECANHIPRENLPARGC